MSPHSVFINFPQKMIGGGIIVQPQIILNKNTDAANESYDAVANNIVFQKIGKIEWKYDNTAFLLVPGEWSFEIFDGNNFLSNYLFYDNTVDKNATFILTVNRGSGFLPEFTGNMEPTYTSFEGSIFKVTAKALARTDILNNTMLFMPDGVTPTNPLGYPSNSYVKITQLLTDIYKKVNPAVTLDISNDWSFIGSAQLQALDSLGNPTGALFVDYQNGAFTDLYIKTAGLFATNNFGLSSLGDILRLLAFEFGAITGMIDNSRTFFKSIYSSSLNIKTLDNTNLQDYSKQFIDIAKTYIYLTMRAPSSGYGSLSTAASAGVFTAMQNQFITQRIYYLLERNSASGVFDGSYFFTSNSQPNNTTPANVQYFVNSVIGTYLGGLSYSDFATFLAQYWLRYKASQQNCEDHHFKFSGTEMDYLNNASFNGNLYQPIGMIKDFDLNTTEIDSILLS